MSALVVISEEQLWDFVRDGFRDGVWNERNHGELSVAYEQETWMESRVREQVANWLEQQRKGHVG